MTLKKKAEEREQRNLEKQQQATKRAEKKA
jgi:hypothetical protein